MEKINIEKDLKSKISEINGYIESFLPRSITPEIAEKLFGPAIFKYDVDTIEKSVFEPMWNLLDRGGKRWRPYLFLLILETFGQEKNLNLDHYKDLCIIPEIVHNGTLVIDDIQDKSELRRGKPALHLLYDVDLSINVGNIMYYLPLLKILDKELPAETKNKIFQIYLEEMVNVSIGQGTDIYWSKKGVIPDEEEYLQMCINKTGCLARMAARLAAAIAGASDEVIDIVGRWAATIGVSFQIKDDILNIKPASDEWGKSVGEDITEGKKTLMVIKALELLDDEERQELIAILESHTKDREKINRAIELITKNGTVDYANKVASQLLIDAWKKVEEILPKNQKQDKLKAFSEYLLKRAV